MVNLGFAVHQGTKAVGFIKASIHTSPYGEVRIGSAPGNGHPDRVIGATSIVKTYEVRDSVCVSPVAVTSSGDYAEQKTNDRQTDKEVTSSK